MMQHTHMLVKFLEQYKTATSEVMRNAAIRWFADDMLSYNDMIFVFGQCNLIDSGYGRTPTQVALGTDYKGDLQ